VKAVTTSHRAGFDQYGFRLIETRHNLPAPLTWYTEGFDVPCETVDLSDIPELQAFKARHAKFKPPNYLFDVVRFSNKVFAAYHALREHNGLGIWIDADCTVYRKMPDGYLQDAIGDAYMALFQRRGMYSETGFWIVNCDHPAHGEVFDTWRRWYTEDAFKTLGGWTDCHTLDATLRKIKPPLVNLSGEFDTDMHPMAKADLGKYIDHAKGARKDTGVSPENAHRG
jgi:hypothetical protein